MASKPDGDAIISHEEVARIAELARLTITPEEAPVFARQLAAILDYAKEIQRVDTAGVPPTTVGAAGTWREDAPAPSLARETVLAEAPDAAAGLFRVPKVL